MKTVNRRNLSGLTAGVVVCCCVDRISRACREKRKVTAMRVWLYSRLSRDEDSELNSLTNQQNILREYATNNNCTVIGESADDNISGMHFNREGINKIYAAVEDKSIDAVIVKDYCAIIGLNQKDLENQGILA